MFSLNLARFRKDRGLSQKDLAALSGISPRMIAHYEKYVSHPSLDKVETLSKVLGVSVNHLLGLDEQINNHRDFVSSVDTRSIKQFKKILGLSPIDRSMIYKMVDGLMRKKEYNQQS